MYAALHSFLYTSSFLQANVVLQVLSATEEFQDFLDEAARHSSSSLVHDLLRVCRGTAYLHPLEPVNSLEKSSGKTATLTTPPGLCGASLPSTLTSPTAHSRWSDY